MTTAPCPTVAQVRDDGYLPRVILTSGRCKKIFLLPLGQSTATDELFPAPFSLGPSACYPASLCWFSASLGYSRTPSRHDVSCAGQGGASLWGGSCVRVGPAPAGVHQVHG